MCVNDFDLEIYPDWVEEMDHMKFAFQIAVS